MDCNIGTLTGLVSGIAVVDADGQKGINTVEHLHLEPTLMARTGGGGLHFFYSIEENIPSKVRVLDGVDLRGEGGFVVLSPSLHNSGKLYSWLEPKGLAKFNKEPFEKIAPLQGNNDVGWSQELFQGVSEGSRNVSAAKLAGRYFGLGLSYSEVYILMSEWNSRNIPPLSDFELQRTMKAIQRRHNEVSAPIQIRTLSQIQNLLAKKGESYG